MKPNPDPVGGFSLLASGMSRRWHVEVDESVESGELSLEIEGGSIYLVIQLQDMETIPKALSFLQTGLQQWQGVSGSTTQGVAVSSSTPQGLGPSHPEKSVDADSLTLGRFGPFSVSLVWDNEDFPRCFVIVGSMAWSTLRLSLETEDIRMLIDALRQVVEDLPRDGGE